MSLHYCCVFALAQEGESVFVNRAHDLLGLAVGSMWPRALEKLMEMEATPSEWWPSAGELSNDSLFVSGPRVDSQERALLVSLAKPVFAPRLAEAAAPYPRLIGVLGVDVSFVDLFDDLLYPNVTRSTTPDLTRADRQRLRPQHSPISVKSAVYKSKNAQLVWDMPYI